MSIPTQDHSLWRWPAFILWLFFFTIGSIPEYIFYYFRDLGQVLTQDAIINSEFALPLALAAYLGYFTYHRCMEADCSILAARSKALQIFIIALAAFLPLILIYMEWRENGSDTLEQVIFWMIALKLLAWFYLYILIIRYYFFDQHAVFKNMPILLPSARAEEIRRKSLRNSENSTSNIEGNAPEPVPFPPVLPNDEETPSTDNDV